MRPDHRVAIDEPETTPLPVPDKPCTSGVNVSSSGKHRRDNLILTIYLIEKRLSQSKNHHFIILKKCHYEVTLTVKRLDCELIPQDYLKDIAVFLGLKPETSKFALQLNFCFLLARHYIWCCKTGNKVPQLNMFLAVLKSQFKIESYKQAPTSKK